MVQFSLVQNVKIGTLVLLTHTGSCGIILLEEIYHHEVCTRTSQTSQEPLLASIVLENDVIENLAEGTLPSLIQWLEENYPKVEGTRTECKGYCPCCYERDLGRIC